MKFNKIIELLNLPENKHIHRTYLSSEKWCYVTLPNGSRIKLMETDTEDYVNRIIQKAKA